MDVELKARIINTLLVLTVVAGLLLVAGCSTPTLQVVTASQEITCIKAPLAELAVRLVDNEYTQIGSGESKTGRKMTFWMHKNGSYLIVLVNPQTNETCIADGGKKLVTDIMPKGSRGA